MLHNAQRYPEVYLPLVNEGGLISSVTPWLAGDCKMDQNTFLLPPADMEGLLENRPTRNFWVLQEGEDPWSVTGQSAAQRVRQYTNEEEETVLNGGLLWQRLTRVHARTGIQVETLSFVPAGCERVEIMQVTLKNCSAAFCTVTPVAVIPLYGRSADNLRDHRHVTSLLHRVEIEKYGLCLKPTMTFDERGHQPGRVAYRVWGACEEGEAPDRLLARTCDFVGDGTYDWPKAFQSPWMEYLKEGDHAQGGEMTAVLYFAQACLEPGESRHYQIVLAVDEKPYAYLKASGIEGALERTKDYWQKTADMGFQTGDPQFDAWSRWCAIQPALRRICGCSFLPHHDYGRGGRGWRDLWQDSLALLLADPKKVRQDLLQYFAGVRLDGTNATIIGAKPGEFKADRNNIPRVWMDHGFWPIFTVMLYLEETGDDGFLLERQPYFSDCLAWRGEGSPRKEPWPVCDGTVFEHMLTQAVAAFFDVGEHGHMRLRGADWNDGLDMAKERGESVAFTAAYAYGLQMLSEMARRLMGQGIPNISLNEALTRLFEFPEEAYGKAGQMREALFSYCGKAGEGRKDEFASEELCLRLDRMSAWIKAHINQEEWVGDSAEQRWFNSYYDNGGRPLEGEEKGRIHMMLTGQVFCILSGTADEGRVRQIVRAADWYLYDPARGGYCLNTDFNEVRMDMGRVFGFAYGHKENGAVFCHMAVMYAYALYSRGFAAEGWRVLEALYGQSSDFGRSRILPGIPEYFDDRGIGMYPWLTGAGSWLMLTMRTQVFGVRGRAGNLELAPQLLAAQFDQNGNAGISCHFRGRPLQVWYRNPQKLDWDQYQVASACVQGKQWTGNAKKLTIPWEELAEGTGQICIEVVLAAKKNQESVL